MAKVRIGVVSAANIGRKVVIPSILRAENAELVALASSGDAGAAFLRETGLDVRLHGSYDELLADPGVDAVYIPLPNHLHAEWSKRAADAGKHVLCEKPAALDAAETADMIEHCVGRGVVWMEAFMYRYHPQWAAVGGCSTRARPASSARCGPSSRSRCTTRPTSAAGRSTAVARSTTSARTA